MITAFLNTTSSTDAPKDSLSLNQSSTPSSAQDVYHAGSSWPHGRWEQYQSDRIVHRRLIHSADSSANAIPMLYVRTDGRRVSESSTDAAPRAPTGYYREIEAHLQELERGEGGYEPVEQGAVGTALQVLKELERHNYAPPMVTSNGSEAVVMLWSLGGTTYAITITDGELGYVVRREKKRIKIVDSIDVKTFKLLDFNSSS
ncbi:hypothetical protein ACYCVF_33625 [Bradyrhizobium sp. 1.29L]